MRGEKKLSPTRTRSSAIWADGSAAAPCPPPSATAKPPRAVSTMSRRTMAPRLHPETGSENGGLGVAAEHGLQRLHYLALGAVRPGAVDQGAHEVAVAR